VELGNRGLTTALVEGGPQLHASFLAGGLADEIMVFTVQQAASPEVRRRTPLRNVVDIPPNWPIVLEEKLGGDRLVVAQTPEAHRKIENLLT
ncbi:MAG: dihydrofolate reductase family protein, partial [Candidatus Neomarinimicrobiota bacterium]